MNSVDTFLGTYLNEGKEKKMRRAIDKKDGGQREGFDRFYLTVPIAEGSMSTQGRV